MKSKLRKDGRGASILLLSIVLMFVLLLLSITLFNLIPAEMHAANRSQQDLNGHYVARAGIQETMTWLKFRIKQFDLTQSETELPDYSTNGTSFPNIDTFVAGANARRPFTKGDWRYEIEIVPQQNTFGLANNFETRLYAVRSTSFLNDRPIRRMDVLLRQKTFASFAWYTEAFDPGSSIMMNGESKVFGPVHTNDWFRFNVASVAGAGWGTDPYFTDVVTHSKEDPSAPAYGDGNTWLGGQPYDTNGPVAGRYESVFDGGRNDLRLKNSIDLPSSTDTVLSATWPDSASLPTTSGAFVSKNPLTGRVDGGIVINGNAQEVNLRLDKYGNQHTVIKQGLAVGSDTKLTENTTKTPYTPKKMGTCGGGCNKWGPPPTGGGGGGGVGGGGAATGSAPCIGWSATYPCEQFQYIPNGTFSSSTSTDDDQFTTEIFEVIEPQAITAADAGLVGTPKPSGTGNFVASDVVATEGQTLVIRKAQIQATDDTDKTYFGTTIARPASGSVTKVVQVEVLDGQINGNIYATGRIGGAESQRHGDTERGVEAVGLWGIAKGSAVVDPATGAFVLDSSGNKTYANKAIVTPLNQSNSSELQANSIALGGDLLQFDPARFATEKAAGLNMGAQNNTSGTVNGVPARAQNWVKVALDPNKTTAGKPDPERSKNSDHVLGLITLDIWMKGPTTGGSTNMNKTGNNGRKLTGGDGISDTYFVALAGKTELATSGPDAGKPLVIAGDTKTSGGLGTWRQHRDNLSDNMGEFRVIGGVIQGTVGKNHFDPGSNDTHNWLDSGGSVGYSLDMFYDIEATRQRVFPVQADFSVVRFLETPARAG